VTDRETVIATGKDKKLAWPEGFKSDPRTQDEVQYIVDQFKQEEGIDIEVAAIGDSVSYLYAKGEILVLVEYLAPVIAVLLRRETIPPIVEATRSIWSGLASVFTRKQPGLLGPVAGEWSSLGDRLPWEPVIAGVVLLRLRVFKIDVQDALDIIDRRLGEGIATPNHVITVASNGTAQPGGNVAICPATEPQEVYEGMEPFPSACQTDGGTGVRVYIADTGLLKGADRKHPWLRGVRRALKPDGTEQDWDPDRRPAQTRQGTLVIPPYSGHGTFVAGVLRCMAPRTDVIVARVFKVAGSKLEKDLVADLTGALRLGVDIFSLSIAASTRKRLPLIGFQKWLNLLSTYKGVACVVAAGNSGSSRPFWPAAFPEVVSVGALARDWHSRAEFSNHGGWVDVYAPGRDLINAYATGPYECYAWPYKDTMREFYGMALWSGTSFSTPQVTGLIAARMSRTGENGRQAAAALLAQARRQAIPGVGAILLPRCGDDNATVTGPPAHCSRHQHQGDAC
jgi:hypothetical protein